MSNENGSRQNDNSMEIGNLHFRLCHLCLFLNEAEAEIEECMRCHHVFRDEALKQFWDNNDQEAFSDQINYPPEQESAEEETESEMEDSNVNGLNARF